MRESQLRVALRRIQDIVREATGISLTNAARDQIETVLSRVAGNSPTALDDEHFSQRDVTILLADLRGFTSITAAQPAGVTIGMLNRCFVKMTQIIFEHNGAIDKFMGDAIMVIFSRNRTAPGEDARDALACAVGMQIAMQELNAAREAGLPELYLGIGINTGSVMAGVVGSEHYSAYTVMGEEVNLASRVEAFSLRGQILISEATHAYCRDFVTVGPPVEVFVKGKADRVQIREVLGIPSLGQVVPRRDMRRSPRVEVKLPVVYQHLRGKVVMPEQRDGLIQDIGYYGVRVAAAQPMPLHSELKLAFDLPLFGYRASEIYARVVKVSEEDGSHIAGLEFSSVGQESERQIKLFVQMLIQGAAP